MLYMAYLGDDERLSQLVVSIKRERASATECVSTRDEHFTEHKSQRARLRRPVLATGKNATARADARMKLPGPNSCPRDAEERRPVFARERHRDALSPNHAS
ncbi:hypothetical protein MRX96_031366 [Rhipicephalus microplus]